MNVERHLQTSSCNPILVPNSHRKTVTKVRPPRYDLGRHDWERSKRRSLRRKWMARSDDFSTPSFFFFSLYDLRSFSKSFCLMGFDLGPNFSRMPRLISDQNRVLTSKIIALEYDKKLSFDPLES